MELIEHLVIKPDDFNYFLANRILNLYKIESKRLLDFNTIEERENYIIDCMNNTIK